MVHNDTIVNPPGRQRDRTAGDQERYRQRNKPGKDKLPDIIKMNPIFDNRGKVKVPVDGGYEPRWRPGRDGKAGSGGGAPSPGEDEADITYIEMSYEEFLKLFFEELELPFLLRKMVCQTELKTHKRRGISNHGPRSRLNKLETAKSRLRRAAALRKAHPEDLGSNFEEQCQDVFESYIYRAARASGMDSLLDVASEPGYVVADEERFFAEVAFSGQEAVANEMEFRGAVLLAVYLHLRYVAGEIPVSYRFNLVVKDHIENYVRDQICNSGDIPDVETVPFHKSDLRYGRIEERLEPDSKAVAFLLLDRSGSMGGDPIAIAKAFFLLNILFLKAKYADVAIVMIAHDAHAERIKDERQFYKIEVGGGTIAAPAWEMARAIAEAEFPAAGWNRYLFHATDGALFDGEEAITQWWTALVESPFNYCGYLEINPDARPGSRNWDWGGQALLALKASVASRVGMAIAASLKDLPRAFREILDKDSR